MTNNRLRLRFDALDRISKFGELHAAAFDPASRATGIFTSLAAIVADMKEAGADRLSGEGTFHAGTSKKQFWAGELRDDLDAIRDTAVAISLAEDTPDFDDHFRVPRSRSYEALAAAARAFLRAAAPHKALFLAFELPANFLEDLAGDLEAFEKADDTQDTGLGTQTGGSANLVHLAAKGMALRKQLLAIVPNKFRADPQTLAEWHTAQNIAWPSRSSQPENPAAPTQPT